ncbi:MAG TPA: sensor histidine kinase [Symbiobacteriaceae bacterium]|nr:sensor histidine kinase [Symbiobacteriaceae bacterium]
MQRRLLSLSRPLAFVGILSIYIIAPDTNVTGMAVYAISTAFFVASSSVINHWLPAPPVWHRITFWAELAVVSGVNLYSSLGTNINAVQSLYMPIIATVPMVADRESWRTAFAAVLGSWLLTSLPTYLYDGSMALLAMAAYGAALMFFWSTGVLMRNLQDEQAKSRALLQEVTESRTALERAHRQLQESAARQQEMAVLQERQRLAREIHDSVAHGLTTLVVQTQAARRLFDKDPDRARETIAKCEEMAREALQETRRAVRALHPAGLEQQTDLEALRRLARDWGLATGMAVEVTADEGALALAPDPNRLEQLYRIFQESLTNAQRHGQAKSASARLQVANGVLSLWIENDGIAPTGLDPGIGLKSMQERAASLGGSVSFEPREHGLQIHVWIPLQREVAG